MLQINRDYLSDPYNYAVMADKVNNYIVIHYVGATGSALQNAQYFMNNKVGASAHYYVGHASENGAIYQSVEDKDRAFHAGYKPMNMMSIGIEMCCHLDGDRWYFDDITVTNTIALTKELMQKYNIPIENVIRHYDVTGKQCPMPFVLDENAWIEFKKRLVEVYIEMDFETALQILVDKKIINSPNYWRMVGDTVNFFKQFVINVAKAL